MSKFFIHKLLVREAVPAVFSHYHMVQQLDLAGLKSLPEQSCLPYVSLTWHGTAGRMIMDKYDP